MSSQMQIASILKCLEIAKNRNQDLITFIGTKQIRTHPETAIGQWKIGHPDGEKNLWIITEKRIYLATNMSNGWTSETIPPVEQIDVRKLTAFYHLVPRRDTL